MRGLFGAAVRFNIARRSRGPRSATEERLETGASWALAFAYAISVAYYLNLFGAFSARIFPGSDAVLARLLTTATYAVILAAGLTKGFALLERM